MDDLRMYAIARRVTDEVLGEGTYDQMNPRLVPIADAGELQLAADQS